jgi:glutamate dehydrogenase
MPGSIPAVRRHLIDAIAARARSDRAQSQVKPASFVRDCYRGVDEDDLGARDPADLAAAAMSLLAFGYRRRKGQPLVRVFNPVQSRDGWTSSNTVVEVVTDDMPFLVDSLAMVLADCGLALRMMVHPVLHVTRDRAGRLTRCACEASAGKLVESWQHVEIDTVADAARIEEVRTRIVAMLTDVRLAVQDWGAMSARAQSLAASLAVGLPGVGRAECNEASAFLSWLGDHHFTFLGYREYKLVRGAKQDRLIPVSGTGLGLLRTGKGRPRPKPSVLRGETRRRAREPAALVVTKANSISTVHRAAYLDYVGVKIIDARGNVTGEQRFLGLFTSLTYSANPRDIPLLRLKIRRIVDQIGAAPGSHDDKALLHVLESYPRDELFQASVPELVRNSRGIVNIYERRRVRMFLRSDPFGRFYSVLLFVPRDRYNTQARLRIEEILLQELAGLTHETQVEISESALARLYVLVRTDPAHEVAVDIERIERRVAEAIRTWEDRLRDELAARLPGERAETFATVFPAAYQDDVPARDAIDDIRELMALPESGTALGLELRAGDAARKALNLRLYRRGDPVAMSDLVPLLENFDLRILNERPYRIGTGHDLWVQVLEVMHAGGRKLDPDKAGHRFEEAFFAVWNGLAESDGVNRLVLAADLHWRQAVVLRAVCRYLLQTGLPFSQRYMETVLERHPGIASRLARTFESRFDPDLKNSTRASQLRSLAREIGQALDRVSRPDDDRILRAFLAVITATLRTNHYQVDADGNSKPCLSFKFDPKILPELPKPRPMFEIWVYSPRVEGVHLRMGKVARGGLRWSDRREDFRTEILGLMKAQNVKNTLIVPVGAKGGFFPKQSPVGGTREEIQREGTECYKMFIRSMLDLTDNVRGNEIVPPARTVRYDPDDPYLVVAADKGTATFSDTANALAAEYDFWLGDAFASGGSAGYDHKKMGITAKGGWECVKRHFREMGTDIQSEDFTVAGIGDMAGDVFGNGMLLSRHIRLVAAFNHQHIFIDPSPDAEASFRERERLFNLPRSSWGDYNPRAISTGGGVHSRDSKEIPLSAQARALLGFEAAKASPTQVIQAILRLPVDLLWNGGIGTYVKASWEANSAIGDRSNDAVRVDGRELRCKVVGEGGNLGLSQLGRIEFALAGGRVNTDFVDNSGGVDCSDHEVNIKIMLDAVGRKTRLTTAARNRLLAEMSDDVGELVLRDNYLQGQAISILEAEAAGRLGEHAHFIRSLELDGVLDRALEFLPNAEDIDERSRAGQGLVRPELAMLLSYAKIQLNQQLIHSDVPEDPYLGQELGRYFPERLTKRYGALLGEHRLKREIIATATTNSIVNRMGPTFVARTRQDSGAGAASVARAYTIAREIFEVRDIWRSVESLDNRVAASVQYEMLRDTVALLRQTTYWLLQRHRGELGIEMQVGRLRTGIRELTAAQPQWLHGLERQAFDARAAELTGAGVPPPLARQVAACSALQSAPDIVEIAVARRLSVDAAAGAYFGAGTEFGLDWLRARIERLNVEGHWQAVARGSLREALYETQRALAQRVLEVSRDRDPARAIERWKTKHQTAVAYVRSVVNDIRGQSTEADFASLAVALQAVRRLVIVEGKTQ